MGFYYQPVKESQETIDLMEKIDMIYTRRPFYGSRRMVAVLKQEGIEVNRKRVMKLMRKLGLAAIYPKKNLSKRDEQAMKYPYLLKGMEIDVPNQVWASDITYIPLRGGFIYLVAIIDWCTRYVLSWRLSNTLDTNFCIEALKEALEGGNPLIFNTDQGSQYTSSEFTEKLERNGIQISMDGRGRVFDNIMIERIWRSVKYEDVYLKKYETANEAEKGLRNYFEFYNKERPHQSLEYLTPYTMYFGKAA